VLAFSGSVELSSPGDAFLTKELLYVEVWENSNSRRLVRLEYGKDMKLLQAMSANFIFISNTDSSKSNSEDLLTILQAAGEHENVV
jgi:hypothetical protein